jgi:hypothetical protein
VSEDAEWAKVWGRLRHPEDGLTERKTESAGSSVFKEVAVSFANGVPEGREGILFVGVANNGDVIGCSNIDSTQKTITRLLEQECYPPVPARFEARAMEEGKEVLAVIVPFSRTRPHFTGHAYRRVGSENRRCDEEAFKDFITTRTSVGAKLLAHKGQVVRVRSYGKKIGNPSPLPPTYTEGGDYIIVNCDVHTVTLRNTGSDVHCVEQTENFSISADPAGKLVFIVREPRR